MTNNGLQTLIFGLLGLLVNCFVFDTEEIKLLNFVVDLLDQPVLLHETPEEQTVQMYNRGGQPYSCLLPDSKLILKSQQDDPDIDDHASVASLLASMSGGPCLQYTKDWWTYELCPMAKIRQYHLEGGQVVGKISVLGQYESDYDWSQDDGRSKNAKHRYHSQTYVNGTDCDLSGLPRSAEVRYVCEEGGDDALVRVDEPETCRYILTVQTARTCRHRALRPPPSGRPQSIVCRPALTEQQLQRLAQARLEKIRRDAETALRLAAFPGHAKSTPAAGSARQMAEQGGRGPSDNHSRPSWERVKAIFDETYEQTHQFGYVLENVIKNLIKILSELKAGSAPAVERLRALLERHQSARGDLVRLTDRIQEFFRQAEEGDHDPQFVAYLSAYNAAQSASSKVIIELSVEFHRLKELVSSDPSMLTERSLEDMVRTMSDLSSVTVQMQQFFTDMKALRLDDVTWAEELSAAGRRPQTASGGGESAERDWADGKESRWDVAASDVGWDKLLTSRQDRPENKRVTSEENSAEGADSEDQEEQRSPNEDAEDEDAVSVGSTRKKRVKFSTLESLRLDKMVQISEIDQQQRFRVERAVKRKLGKVGLDTNGPQIKVRFLKFPDLNNLEKEHTLTEEELSAFENALITIMMGGQGALLEHNKHRQQAKNYEYSLDQAIRNLETDDQPSEDGSLDMEESLFTLM